MIFDLVKDFADVVEAMPQEHPRYRILKLLQEALRRDVHFLNRHPTTLFQCLWNSGWWYDCPQAAQHYVEPEGGWKEPPPWEREGPKLCELLERWREDKEGESPGFPWLRSLRPPPMHLGTAQQAVFRGHERGVNCVAFSPDGTRIAIGGGSYDKTVRVWDASSGAELACLKGHEGGVTSVAFSPDGRRIASGADDKTVRVWDAASGAELACLRGHKSFVSRVAYSPDGTRIASGADDKTVRVWDAASGDCLEVIEGTGDVAAIAATAAENPSLNLRALVRDPETFVVPPNAPPLAIFPEAIYHVATHPSGRRWAGHVLISYLCLTQLEGDIEPPINDS